MLTEEGIFLSTKKKNDGRIPIYLPEATIEMVVEPAEVKVTPHSTCPTGGVSKRQKRSERIAVILFSTAMLTIISLVGCIVFFLYAMWPTFDDACGNYEVAKYISPEASLHVVVFQRDCGATTGFSTQASILSAGEALENEGGNTVIADTDHGAAPSGNGGGPELRVKWIAPRTVQISYHEKARVFKNKTEVDGVRIEYTTFK